MLRFREDGGSDIERRLLASAADDEMPEEKLQALVKWGAGLPPVAAPAAAKSTWKLTIAKGIGLLALAAVSIGVVEHVATSHAPSSAPVRAARGTSSSGASTAALAGHPSEALAAPPADPAPVVIPVVSLDQLPTAPVPPASAASSAAAHAAKTRPLGDDDASFAEQMKLIDAARTRLRRDDPRGALAVLDDYERRFPTPAFGEEATVLRVSALAKAGDHARARRIGEAFLGAHPSEIYRRRVEAVVRALDEQEGTP